MMTTEPMTPEQIQAVVDEMNAFLDIRSTGFAWSGKTVDTVQRFDEVTPELYKAEVYNCLFDLPVLGKRLLTATLYFVRDPYNGKLTLSGGTHIYDKPTEKPEAAAASVVQPCSAIPETDAPVTAAALEEGAIHDHH
jgi:hypothetical protein